MMLIRVKFHPICLAFCLSFLTIPALSRLIHNSDDSNTQAIMGKTRTKIKYDLSTYNFSNVGVHSLEDLVMESGGRPIQSLIISTWRSGSTFLGEVLNSIPGNFYHYEPFLYRGVKQIRGPPYAHTSLSIIKNFFQCNFNGLDDYYKFGRTHMNQSVHSTRPWDDCQYNNELCFDADFTSKFCKLFPFQSMKVLRVRLQLIKELLDDKELNVRVVLLIRDPRGVMQSRQNNSFCVAAPDCSQPEIHCTDMVSDYMAASRLLSQYPDKLTVLRFEDLALNINATTERLLKFLRLNLTPSLYEYLRLHTTTQTPGDFTTFRITHQVPFKWKTALDYNRVAEIQAVCKDAMDLWGYHLAHNATHMASKEFDPIGDYTIT